MSVDISYSGPWCCSSITVMINCPYPISKYLKGTEPSLIEIHREARQRSHNFLQSHSAVGIENTETLGKGAKDKDNERRELRVYNGVTIIEFLNNKILSHCLQQLGNSTIGGSLADTDTHLTSVQF